MRNRCTSPLSPAWDNYGGRGITVCDRWLRSFEHFLEDMGRRPARGYEIDRIDNEGHYEPGNCRWTTQKENSRNRRSARLVEFRGRVMCLSAAAEEAGISYSVVQKRVDGPLQWTIDRALTTPVRAKSKKGEGFKPAPLTNATGLCGVKTTQSGKFCGRATVNGKRLQTPSFATPEEAHQAYLKLTSQIIK